jgi:hypothetical protein
MTLSVTPSVVTDRWRSLKRTFSPITPNGRVESFVRPTATGVISGLAREPNVQDLRRMRHPCRIPNIYINYFEIWRSDSDLDQFLLDKAYFHLDTPTWLPRD